ncbi:hypothetical protein M8818_007668 [Zalaria obscura]|uniref:Uncharacterized protein n=1 Tax=Zalaria obscura TaxID=2024903 RepID=A0ACC3S2G9_9PEZI
MSDSQSTDDRRPRALHSSRSFTRLESPQASPASSRTRASTIGTAIPSIPEARRIPPSAEEQGRRKGDIFESLDEHEEHPDPEPITPSRPEVQLPETFDQLPIEIRNLTDRFLKSLSAKVHAAPLTIDAISELFQEFYLQAESHIATHIATLSSRLSREKSPAESATSKSSATSKGRSRGNSNPDRKGSGDAATGEQQMLTASEITDKRKSRRLLELKRTALEEAVERGVCEKVYDRIYMHRSTDDAERDAKLQSRTAALALVGIGLKELHVEVGESTGEPDAEKEDEISKSLGPARESLRLMSEEHYPLGKLQHLTAAHKSIVETLSQLFPSSSSADEVLPTLIYTLITSPPETLSVISDLSFVQRFRAAHKVDGEAAYCLVNLEAAISFLETVDLSSLRADEAPEGPPKTSSQPNSRPETPTPDIAVDSAPNQPSAPRSLTPSLSPASAVSSTLDSNTSSASKPLPSLSAQSTLSSNLQPRITPHRRLSSLIAQQAERIEAGRENILSTADKAFDSINSTLEDSFKFLFGRLKEQQADLDTPGSPLLVPKTLEDARNLISSPSRAVDGERELDSGDRSPDSATVDDPLSTAGHPLKNDKLLDMVGGRSHRRHDPLRDRSVDSTKSASSGKRVAFAQNSAAAQSLRASDREKMPPPAPPVPAASGVGDVLNAINPLKGFGVPSFGRFGRSASASSTPAPLTPGTEKGRQLGHPGGALTSGTGGEEEGEREEDSDSLNAREALAVLKKAKPPIRRFMEVRDAKLLRLGEVEELLRDYRRLAEVLREAIQSA